MKRLLLLSALLFGSLIVFAQTQQGYVKTKGRMVNGQLVPGQGLKGATVSVHGRTAVLVNSEDGAFSFPTPDNQFRLDSVKKKGYLLVDLDACPRTYKTSGNPLYLVMETPEQQLQDKLNAERKIRRNLQKQLQEREDEIEDLKTQQKISDEEYRQALQKLYADQESNEQLISDMAKRYSELDYDQLDEFYRQVSYHIENGELVKADSLLKTRGDITAQVGNILQRGQTLAEQDEHLQKAKAVQQADIDEAARRCYSYYETFAAQHLNDTAAYYLELRASLDTTNIKWQLDADRFLFEYVASYDKALYYCQRALRHALIQFGEDHQEVATIYNELNCVLVEKGDFDKALELLMKTLKIEESLGVEPHEIATTYNNIGVTYERIGDYDKALEYHKKAISIREKEKESDPIGLAFSLNSIGTVYNFKGAYQDAKKSYNTAIDLMESVYGKNHHILANMYSNMAVTNYNLGEFDLALKNIEEALSIWESILGKSHPNTAIAYRNMGVIYYTQLNDYDNALLYLEKAKKIDENVFGENNPKTAISYECLGNYYNTKGEYDKALEYLTRSVNIQIEYVGEHHPDVASCYNTIGWVYSNMGQYDKSIENYEKSLRLNQELYGEYHSNTAWSYHNIGLVYFYKKDYDKALFYHKKALSIRKTVWQDQHEEVAWSYNNVGNSHYCLKQFNEALENYNESYQILLSVLGEDHPNTIIVKDKISEIQAKIAEQENK